MPISRWYIFFGKMSIQVLCSFLKSILFCFQLFIQFKYYPLLIILVANVFSHSISCLLLLFLVSFAVQKFLSLIRYHLFIFIFISFALGNKSKIYTIYVKDCSFFSSRSFMVSSLTFRS